MLTVDRAQRRARLELFWQGGAHTELDVELNRTAAKRTDTSENLVALIRRLAEHIPDAEIAMILAKQGHRTATGLTFTASRVAGIRERAHILAGPQHPPGPGTGISIHDAARQLGVCTQTIRRWLREGLLPAEQTAPHAPWRIKLTDDIRRRFIPEDPTATSASPRPLPRAGSPVRPSSTKSAAVNATPSTSPKADVADSAFNSIRTNKAC